jgi:hypothetical protein
MYQARLMVRRSDVDRPDQKRFEVPGQPPPRSDERDKRLNGANGAPAAPAPAANHTHASQAHVQTSTTISSIAGCAMTPAG